MSPSQSVTVCQQCSCDWLVWFSNSFSYQILNSLLSFEKNPVVSGSVGSCLCICSCKGRTSQSLFDLSFLHVLKVLMESVVLSVHLY